MRLDPTPSKLSGINWSSKAVRQRLEQHCGRLTASHLRIKSLLATSVPGFIDRVAYLVGDEVAAHHVRFMDVVASASYRLELDLQSIVEVLCTAERKGGRASSANQETSGMPPSLHLVPGSDWYAG